ncbi:MAG: hypothetical protein A4E63_00069 [Syntrophorhabdus sp. PtaU1.Bin050]|nr:MAG: hypothetical protein A4E63_00069 [Syntrophorhabdus sp. PtaU1.Bin050]
MSFRDAEYVRYRPVVGAGGDDVPGVEGAEVKGTGREGGVLEGKVRVRLGEAHPFVSVKQDKRRGPVQDRIDALLHVPRRKLELADPAGVFLLRRQAAHEVHGADKGVPELLSRPAQPRRRHGRYPPKRLPIVDGNEPGALGVLGAGSEAGGVDDLLYQFSLDGPIEKISNGAPRPHHLRHLPERRHEVLLHFGDGPSLKIAVPYRPGGTNKQAMSAIIAELGTRNLRNAARLPPRENLGTDTDAKPVLPAYLSVYGDETAVIHTSPGVFRSTGCGHDRTMKPSRRPDAAAPMPRGRRIISPPRT